MAIKITTQKVETWKKKNPNGQFERLNLLLPTIQQSVGFRLVRSPNNLPASPRKRLGH